MRCYVESQEWWPVPCPDLLGSEHDKEIPDEIIERWRAAHREFHAASLALAEAGGWRILSDLDWGPTVTPPEDDPPGTSVRP